MITREVLLATGLLIDIVYAQFDASTCGSQKGCLFAPPGCRPGTDCMIQFSYVVDGPFLDMELAGTPSVTNGYIAVGFSQDDRMGDDMVVYCANFNGSPVGGLARNEPQKANTLLSNVGIQDVRQAVVNGNALYCAINQRIDSNEAGLVNLNGTYYILLSSGPVEGNRLNYHGTNRYVLPRTVLSAYVRGVGFVGGLGRDEGGRSTNDRLMIAHGILMVLSWSIFLSTGILFARNFKGHFPDTTLCGLKLWFHFHRTLNMIGIGGTIAAFVVVFVAHDWRWIGPKAYQSKELNNRWSSVHAMLGLIACVVAWAQPLGAVFRCHPDHKARPIFNVVHGFFGAGAWLCAVAAIMIAVVHFKGMFSDRDAALGLFIAFTAIAGLTIIAMETLTFKVWWTGRRRVSEMEMVRVGGSSGSAVSEDIEKAQRLQWFILLFFLVVAIGTAIAISILIGLKPKL
ncbi:unnamed protein product [Cylicocyclus nassatus]|uniref:Ferric-chelate reductase 1 n=1 Tax=Cylicocyclus nassatus TaxID=53992 RepID=A0AA36MA98_CYLNA|nr:unnamed protein product [Cylicocyclus nassatus]